MLERAVCEVLEGSVGSSGFSDSFGSSRSSAPGVPPISSSFGVGLCGRVRPSGLGRLLSNRSSVVVRRGSVNRRWFSGVPPSRVDVLVQRVGPKLGDHHVRPFPFRSVVRRGSSSLHQCKGAPRGREGRPGFSPSSQGAFRSGVLRQHHRDQLSASPRRDFVSDPQFVMGKRNVVADALSRPDQVLGLEWTLRQEVFDSEEAVASHGGSFCYLTELPLVCLFCSHVGSDGSCDGCHAPSLGSSAGLRLSSSGDDPCFTEQDQELCGGGDHPDRPVLANEGVVPISVVPAVGASDLPSVAVGSVPSASCQKVPSKIIRSSSSCVEALQ